MPYDEARSHRLDVYNDAEGSHRGKVCNKRDCDYDHLRPICYSPIPAIDCTRPKFRRPFLRGRARFSDIVSLVFSTRISTDSGTGTRAGKAISQKLRIEPIALTTTPAIWLRLGLATTTPKEAGRVGITPSPTRLPWKAKGPAAVRPTGAREDKVRGVYPSPHLSLLYFADCCIRHP
jgi:hypothetical protein